MSDEVAFLTAVTSYVGAHGLGTVGTDLFYNYFPGDPRDVVVIMGGGGPPHHSDKTHRRGLSVQVRNQDSAEALTKINSLRALFDDKWGRLGTSDFAGRFTAAGELGPPVIDAAQDTVYNSNHVFVSSQ